MAKYKYGLKTYHRAAEKPDCPACGHKHRFSEYIDLLTGLPVGPGVGKCDRINHCGYSMTPSEYFKKNPQACPEHGRRARYGNKDFVPVIIPAHKPRLFLPENVIEQYKSDFMTCNFGRWLATKAPSVEILKQTAEMYRLTATKTNAIIFWYIDFNGRVCQGKMMWYKVDGHRNGFASTISSDLAKKHELPENAEMEHCLFGAHLLKQRPTDVVYLVESEKTAIVMSMLQPQYLWIATGGCSMLNTYVVRPLVGRRVVIIPDSGCLSKWQKIMEQTSGIDYSFYEDLENYPANFDLLDVLFPNE